MKRFYCPNCRMGIGNVRPVYVRVYEVEDKNGKFIPPMVKDVRQCYCLSCDDVIPAMMEKPEPRSLRKQRG